MESDKLDVLLIGENQRGCSYLARYLERLGCECSFASTNAEVGAVLGQRPCRLILSTRPVTQGGQLMEALVRSECAVYYSVPVEDGCLWFQAFPKAGVCPLVSALRPAEFMSALRDLITRWTAAPDPPGIVGAALRASAAQR